MKSKKSRSAASLGAVALAFCMQWSAAARAQTAYEWVQVPGAATKIAVSPGWTPWVLNAAGTVYQYGYWNDSLFGSFEAVQPSGCAREIGVGSENGVDDAWVIGCSSNGEEGNGIYELTAYDDGPPPLAQ
jgi:hypothetical protein